jgi:predicted transcriptional regulator
MSKTTTVTISERARSVAEKRVVEEGFSSIDQYIDVLILEDDLDAILPQDWVRAKIEEGLNSPDAGELTRGRIAEIVSEGIEAATKRA